MDNIKSDFAGLFKKFRLRSGFATLSEFSEALAKEGLTYEDSLFSHWQKGDRIPRDRNLVLAVINIFIRNSGITSLDEGNLLLAATGQRDLNREEIELFSKKIVKEAPFSVPVDISLFVGREKYLKEISWQLLNKKCVLLHGEAGIGKTAIAIKIAHILKEKYSDGILWYRYDIKGAESILDDIARTHGEDISRIRDKRTKAEIVKKLIGKKEILIILDNVENFTEINLFLPDQNKTYPLLITSKYIYKKDRVLYLTSINAFNEVEFLTLAKKILGLPFLIVNKKSLLQIAHLSEYSPLVVTIILKRIESYPQLLKKVLKSFDQESSNLYSTPYDNKNLNISLSFSFSILPPEVKSTFLSLAVFKGPDFSEEAVAKINKISREKVKERLIYLKNFSLIEHSKDNRWRLHSLIRIFIKNKFKDNNLYSLLALYFTDFLNQSRQESGIHQGIIEKEIDNILGIFVKCHQLNFYREEIGLWEYLGIYWWEVGKWKEVERYGSMVAEACKRSNNLYSLAKLLIRDLSWLHYWKGEIEKAKGLIDQGYQVAKKIKAEELLALASIRQGKIYLSQSLLPQAIQLFNEGYLYYKKKADKEKQGDLLTYIGETYWMMKQNKKAKDFFMKALKITNEINDVLQKTTILSRIGCIELQKKHLNQACSYFKKSLLIRKQTGSRAGDMFWNNLALGLAYKMQKKHQIANEKFQLAKKQMIFGGYKERILKVDIFPLIFKKELTESNFYEN